jgi:hypothetical protein
MDYLGNRVATGVQDWVTNSTEEWFTQHPLIAWGINHPLWTLGFALIALFLSWGFLKAIAQLVERVWLLIFQSPLKLGQWLFQSLFNFYKQGTLASEQTEQSGDRLTIILQRLDRLRQEQDELLEEVKTMLSSK